MMQYNSEVVKLSSDERRSQLGQYMTPDKIARFMVSLFDSSKKDPVRLLDPGAGLGILSLAFLERNLHRKLEITAYEIDPDLKRYCEGHLKKNWQVNDPSFDCKVVEEDFIKSAIDLIKSGEFKGFTHVILNPPYKKIHSKSDYRLLLRSIGIETVNLYTAFLALSIHLTQDGGEIVAIIPRSFCNGSYYKSFRSWMLKNVAIKQIHLFESRNQTFIEDNILQENIVIHLTKNGNQNSVNISSSSDASFTDYKSTICDYKQVVNENDENFFIRIPLEHKELPLSIKYTLAEIGLEISTGPVVDFRFKEYLYAQIDVDRVPIVYPSHFEKDKVLWPRPDAKKPNYIQRSQRTEKEIWPMGFYVAVRRISSKEEKRRVFANIIDPDFFNATQISFENHLNIFHMKKEPIDKNLAYGLCAFLNSSIVDSLIRSFSGNTQINATDLRALRYPSRENLIRLGSLKSPQSTDELIHKLI